MTVTSACPSCGFQIREPDTRYCSRCGQDLSRPSGRDSFDGLIGQTIEGRYRVVERIGAGGMGVVYRVEHVRMGKIAAMKVLRRDVADDGQAAKRFRREVETVSALDHPNIVQTFDFGEWRGLLYLVMEYLRGEDLGTIVKREGAMPLVRALPLFAQVCAALEEAHHHGIIHRDLKPDNIVCLQRRGQGESIKVLDFGLAKIMTRSNLADVTGAGSLVGTPYYMAPEQVRSEPCDARTDIYSLGATLYRVVTGTPVFQADSPMAILTRHVNDDPEPPSRRAPALGLPREVDHLLLKALAKQRENRFATAAEMKDAIEHILTDVLHIALEPRRTNSVRRSSGERLAVREVLPLQAAVGAAARSAGMSIGGVQAIDGSAQTAIAPSTGGTRAGIHALSDTPGGIPSWVENPWTADGADLANRELSPSESNAIPDTQVSYDGQSEVGNSLRREDVDAFERQLKRRKRRALLLAGVMSTALVLTGAWVWRYLSTRAGTTESEPNDSAATANLLSTGAPIYGHIGTPRTDGTPDFDYFEVPASHSTLPTAQVPRERVVRLTLSAVVDMDLVLELFDHTGKPLARSDAGKRGQSEVLGPLRIGPHPHYVRVRAVWVEGQPHAISSSPYALTVTWGHSDLVWESEPNDTAESANEVSVGDERRGYLHGPEDEDHYRVQGVPSAKVWVTLTGGFGPMRLFVPGAKLPTFEVPGGEVKVPTELTLGVDGTRVVVVSESKRSREKGETGSDRTIPYQIMFESAR